MAPEEAKLTLLPDSNGDVASMCVKDMVGHPEWRVSTVLRLGRERIGVIGVSVSAGLLAPTGKQHGRWNGYVDTLRQLSK